VNNGITFKIMLVHRDVLYGILRHLVTNYRTASLIGVVDDVLPAMFMNYSLGWITKSAIIDTQVDYTE